MNPSSNLSFKFLQMEQGQAYQIEPLETRLVYKGGVNQVMICPIAQIPQGFISALISQALSKLPILQRPTFQRQVARQLDEHIQGIGGYLNVHTLPGETFIEGNDVDFGIYQGRHSDNKAKPHRVMGVNGSREAKEIHIFSPLTPDQILQVALYVLIWTPLDPNQMQIIKIIAPTVGKKNNNLDAPIVSLSVKGARTYTELGDIQIIM